MTAAITRASVWSEFGPLIVDGALPDPESIRFQPGMVAVTLDNAGDLFAWAGYLGARADASAVNFSDDSGHWLMSAHAWGWHGWTVQLWTSNASELHRPKSIPAGGEEVVGPVEGSGPTTAPDVAWCARCTLPIQRGLIWVHMAGEDGRCADGKGYATPYEDSPGRVEEVSGSAVTAMPRQAEPVADVWVSRRRRGIHYHQLDGKWGADYTSCGRAVRPNGVRLLVDEALVFGAVPCPRCYGTEG